MFSEVQKFSKQSNQLVQAVDIVFQSFIPPLNEQLDDLHEHIEQVISRYVLTLKEHGPEIQTQTKTIRSKVHVVKEGARSDLGNFNVIFERTRSDGKHGHS